MRTKGKKFVEKIAIERIYRLFELAGQEFAKHPERSKRYVELARKIGKRNNVSIPQELRKDFCKNCGAFLVSGENCLLRVKGKLLNVTCKKCGKTKRVGLVGKK